MIANFRFILLFQKKNLNVLHLKVKHNLFWIIFPSLFYSTIIIITLLNNFILVVLDSPRWRVSPLPTKWALLIFIYDINFRRRNGDWCSAKSVSHVNNWDMVALKLFFVCVGITLIITTYEFGSESEFAYTFSSGSSAIVFDGVSSNNQSSLKNSNLNGIWWQWIMRSWHN